MKSTNSKVLFDLLIITFGLVGLFFYLYGNVLTFQNDRSSVIGMALYSVGFILLYIMITMGLKRHEKNLEEIGYKTQSNERKVINLIIFSAWAFLSSVVPGVMLKVTLPANEFELYTGLGHPLGLLLAILVYTGTIGLASAVVLMLIVSYINANKRKMSMQQGDKICASCNRIISVGTKELRCPCCGFPMGFPPT